MNLRLDTKILKLWPKLVDHYITYQELLEDGKIDSLIDKSRRVTNLKNHVDDEIEKAVPDYAA